MKKISLILAVLLLFSGCDAVKSQAKTDFSAAEIAASVILGQGNDLKMEPLYFENARMKEYLLLYYGIPFSDVEDCAVAYVGGMEAAEVAVLRLKNSDAAQNAEAKLQEYLPKRAAEFSGYAPLEAQMAREGRVVLVDNYAAMFILPDTKKAESDLARCFEQGTQKPDLSLAFIEVPEDTTGSQITTTPGGTTLPPDEEYDGEAVLAAWKAGDSSALSGKNLAVYTEAERIIGEIIYDSMNNYEKELAVHDYMIYNYSYDKSGQHRGDENAHLPDSVNPYGMLMDGVGICSGYSTTFKLFMDMLDIECIIVPGTSEGREHAWNMVNLDDEWYIVDVTWDAPYGGRPNHKYFNVTSKFLRNNRHEWEEDRFPAAKGTKYAYK